MQIQSTSTSSAMVQHRSVGSNGDETSNGINPVNASARDRQSDDGKKSTQQQAIINSNNTTPSTPNLHIQRVIAAKPVNNEALASSTHSAQQAVQTFQQIDLMGQPEVMHRIDASA